VPVSDDEPLQAMVWMLEYAHMLAEAAGAIPPAAAYQLRERLRGKKIGLVCSGRNTSIAAGYRARPGTAWRKWIITMRYSRECESASEMHLEAVNL